MRRTFLLIGAAYMAAAPLAYVAYQIVEWPGVAVLGLLIAGLATRIELESEGPVGHSQATGIYAASLQGRESMSASERAAMRADAAVNVSGARIAQMVGAALMVSGAIGFFFT
jgi:hypothetical protein